MAALPLLVQLSQKGGVERRLEEFGRDPTLTVACVLLIVVSLVWIVVSRLIYRNLQRTAQRRAIPRGAVRAPRDIWKAPP